MTVFLYRNEKYLNTHTHISTYNFRAAQLNEDFVGKNFNYTTISSFVSCTFKIYLLLFVFCAEKKETQQQKTREKPEKSLQKNEKSDRKYSHERKHPHTSTTPTQLRNVCKRRSMRSQIDSTITFHDLALTHALTHGLLLSLIERGNHKILH